MEAKEKNSPLTRMHSSRMRTAGFSTVIGGGGGGGLRYRERHG